VAKKNYIRKTDAFRFNETKPECKVSFKDVSDDDVEIIKGETVRLVVYEGVKLKVNKRRRDLKRKNH